MKKTALLFSISLFIAAGICAQTGINNEVRRPKNIIFLIGDGMGLNHLYATYMVKQDNLNIARLNYIGMQITSSADELITDSAASGTALATGNKTNNKHIGVGPDGQKFTSILEHAEAHGKSTGLIATATITHATPASFIAHNPSRYDYEGIAADFLNTDIDVVIGGGYDHFAKRKDGMNLIDSLINRDYTVIETIEELKQTTEDKIFALLYEEHPPTMIEGRGNFLEDASIKAISILDQNPEGFFIMIEGSQIDWAGHDNNTEYLIAENVDFDNVVGKMLDFAEKDGETLVIVTADHETGGFTVTGGDWDKKEVHGNFSSKHHTSVFIPVYAYGPGAENFTGFYQNTEIFHKMMKAFGFKE